MCKERVRTIGSINWNFAGHGQQAYKCLFESCKRPRLAHACCKGTRQKPANGHDALLLQRIAWDLLPTILHRHDNTQHGL